MRVWIGIVVIVALSGCNTGPKEMLSAAPKPALGQGWKEYTSADGKYSIGAPPGWSDRLKPQGLMGEMNMSEMPKEVKDMLGDIPAQQEQFEKEEAAAEAKNNAAKGIVLKLYDNQSRIILAEIPTGVVVSVTGGSGTLMGDAEAYRKNFKAADIKGQKSVTLPMGAAEEIIVQATDVKGDVVNRIAYVMSHAGQRVQLEFRQTNNTGIEQVAREVAETFRIQI